MTGATDGVVQALRGLIATHGVDRVTTNAAWVRNSLADLSPETRAFNRVLMVAVLEGVPADLRRAATGGSVSLAIARGVDLLVGGYYIDRGGAADAVNAWARVLDLADTVAPAPVPPPPVRPANPTVVPVALEPVPPPATPQSRPRGQGNAVPRRKPSADEIHPGAVLSECDLSQRDLTLANLREADLSGSNLIGALLTKANLSRADLSGADLTGAFLSEANLRGADLSRADLSMAKLYGANLSGANLSGANLVDATIDGAVGYEP